MKVEAGENSVRLIPETDWEIQQLERLRTRQVEKWEFEDDWNYKGPLTITFAKHTFDKKPT